MAWNASKQTTFEARLHSIARHQQSLRDEARRLVELWFAEGVSGSPDFVDGDVTTAEMTSMITMCQDVEKFYENEAVTTSDRQANLQPFLTSG